MNEADVSIVEDNENGYRVGSLFAVGEKGKAYLAYSEGQRFVIVQPVGLSDDDYEKLSRSNAVADYFRKNGFYYIVLRCNCEDNGQVSLADLIALYKGLPIDLSEYVKYQITDLFALGERVKLSLASVKDSGDKVVIMQLIGLSEGDRESFRKGACEFLELDESDFIVLKYEDGMSPADIRQKLRGLPVPEIRYQNITKLSDVGGQGMVYRADDTFFTQVVAIKELRIRNPNLRERFKREMKLLRELQYEKHIVYAYRFLELRGSDYIVMEYVDGMSLAGLLENREKLPACLALHILKEVCAGLGAAHEKGIIHRDIKPDNILISKNCDVKLTDFGIAITEQDLAAGNIRFGGTLEYLSLEQMPPGEEVDRRTDIYSLGVTLYTMLLGKEPFSDSDNQGLSTRERLAAQRKRMVEGDWRKPRELDPSIPPVLNDFIVRMMEMDKRKRFRDVRHLLQELKPLLSACDVPYVPFRAALKGSIAGKDIDYKQYRLRNGSVVDLYQYPESIYSVHHVRMKVEVPVPPMAEFSGVRYSSLTAELFRDDEESRRIFSLGSDSFRYYRWEDYQTYRSTGLLEFLSPENRKFLVKTELGPYVCWKNVILEPDQDSMLKLDSLTQEHRPKIILPHAFDAESGADITERTSFEIRAGNGDWVPLHDKDGDILASGNAVFIRASCGGYEDRMFSSSLSAEWYQDIVSVDMLLYRQQDTDETTGAGGAGARPEPVTVEATSTSVPSVERDAAVPEKIGKYWIEKLLAAGEGRHVYRAMDSVLNQTVVVKELAVDSETALRRFKREVEILRKLHSSMHVVNILEEFQEGTSGYIVLEYVDGMSLADLIEKQKGLPVPLAMDIADEICRGLNDIHEKRIIHLNIHPDNVLISRNGAVKLAGFGLAVPENDVAGDAADMEQKASSLNSLCFMAPEQLSSDGEVDVRTDLYQLGATLYTMLFAESPFTGNSNEELRKKIMQGDYIRPVDRNPAIPDSVNDCIAAMMSADKNGRALSSDAGDRRAMFRSVFFDEWGFWSLIKKEWNWSDRLLRSVRASSVACDGRIDYSCFKFGDGRTVNLYSQEQLSILKIQFNQGGVSDDRESIPVSAFVFNDRGGIHRMLDFAWDRDGSCWTGCCSSEPGDYLVKVEFGSYVCWKNVCLESGEELALAFDSSKWERRAKTLLPHAFDAVSGKDITGLARFEVKDKTGSWIPLAEAVGDILSGENAVCIRASCDGYEGRTFNAGLTALWFQDSVVVDILLRRQQEL